MPQNPLIRTLMVAGWFVLGAVFAGWQLSDGKLTKAIRDAAHIEGAGESGEESDGITFGGETHQLSTGDEGGGENADEGDGQATGDDDDSDSVDEADAGESGESGLQSDEAEDPRYEAAADSGQADEDDEDDEDDHVGIDEEQDTRADDDTANGGGFSLMLRNR